MLLHKFVGNDNPYLYDARTNFIFRVKDQSNDTIIDDANRIYFELFGEEFLKRLPEKFELKFPFEKNEIIEKIKNEAQQMILNTTEQCNFRCRYCIYSGEYYYERMHSNRSMNERIMNKALDLFFSSNKNRNVVYVGFYGGEPLIEFELIKNAVRYIKEKYAGRNVIFSMTTNGSLLTPEKFDFLVDNDFSLLVSLDGPKQIHDRNRLFVNGDGTYDIIINNLSKLKTYSSGYYNSNVSFLSTISNSLDLKIVEEFFKNTNLTKEHICTSSFVNPYDNKLLINYPENLSLILEKLGKEHSQSIVESRDFSPLLRRLFDLELKIIYKRETGITQSVPLKGTCIPGARKMFVTTDGNIHICERVGNAFNIGNVEDGIDYTSVFKLIDEYTNLSQIDCPTCWAVRLCEPCYAYFRKNDNLDLGRKKDVCNTLRDNLSRALSFYTEIFTKSPQALNQYFASDSTSVELSDHITYF